MLRARDGICIPKQPKGQMIICKSLGRRHAAVQVPGPFSLIRDAFLALLVRVATVWQDYVAICGLGGVR